MYSNIEKYKNNPGMRIILIYLFGFPESPIVLLMGKFRKLSEVC